jgi:N-acetylneuraminic acid mutarotase
MLDLTNLLAGWRWLVPAMSSARTYTSGTLLPDNKTFLVIGGEVNGARLSSCEKLDIAANTWSSAGNLLGPRFDHCSVLFNNKVVVLGGRDASGSGLLKTCEQYDSASNTWLSFTSFSTPRFSFGATVVMNKIYIAGGSSNGGITLSSVEVYNGASWLPLPSLPVGSRDSCATVAFQNKVVVLGASYSRTTIEVFDPATSTWSTAFPTMTASPSRSNPAVVSFF